MKYLLLTLYALLTINHLAAKEPEVKEPPLDPEYQGVHGLVLMEANYKLYVANLAKYRKPHNAQIVYKIETSEEALLLMVRDADLVTLKPRAFNLERMLRGHKFKIVGDLYLGNYQKGGMKVRENVQIVLSEQLFKRKLEDLGAPTNQQTYEVVRVGNAQKLMVHHVQGSPSYAHIVYFDPDDACMNQFYTSSSIPSQSELFSRMTHCGPMKVLYYEVEDFR